MIENYVEQINLRIAGLQVGNEFTLPVLLAEEWNAISALHGAQAFGRAFSRAVEAGLFPGVEFVRIQRSPRISVWIKTA
jgi:hypothetical protein